MGIESLGRGRVEEVEIWWSASVSRRPSIRDDCISTFVDAVKPRPRPAKGGFGQVRMIDDLHGAAGSCIQPRQLHVRHAGVQARFRQLQSQSIRRST